MKLEFKIEVDLTDTILESDSDPFVGYSSADWEAHIKEELREKLEQIETDCGAVIYLFDNSDNRIY